MTIQGRVVEAERIFRQRRLFFGSNRNKMFANKCILASAECSRLLGVVLQEQNKNDLALELYDEALFFLRTSRDELAAESIKALIFQNKTNAYKAMGKHDSALECARMSVTIDNRNVSVSGVNDYSAEAACE